MAGLDSFEKDELRQAMEADCSIAEGCSGNLSIDRPSSGADEIKGLRIANRTVFDDLFESESDSNCSGSLFGDLGVKNLFGGSSIFGESDDECQKNIFETVVDGDIATNVDEDDWPAPPDFPENSDVLDTVRTLALENFDVILQRTVRERSSELNDLQNSARPVTGTNARDNLSDFFARAINPDAEPSQQERSSLPDDVQNLIQRSIVTTALRRHGFRTALEQSLSSRLTPTSVLRDSFVSRNSPARSVSGISSPSVSQQELDAISILSEAASDQNDAASDIQQLHRVIDAGVQVLSETIEEDINHLHHLHVVSSVLSGGFRNDLERLFHERARTVGGGAIVQQFIRSLPSASRPRVSNVSSAQSARSSQTTSRSQNMQLSSEIGILKQQMAEMKEILQMTFEMQMDTQRAIQQEVSAVFSAFMQQMSQASASGLPAHQTSIPSRNPVTVTAGSCVICLDNQVDAVFYQCGHMCACHTCGLQLRMKGHKCPMCRAPIRDVIRAYKTQ